MAVVAPAAAATTPLEDRFLADPGRIEHRGTPSPPVLAPNAQLQPCKDAKPDGMCGTVTVPLDRTDPAKGTIDLFFEYFAHRSPGPATSTILITEGGPGASVTQDPFIGPYYRDLFDPLMDTRDLILLDQRGVGRSGPIDCPSLQHASKPIREAVRECGAQLGPAASLYASDNVALDIEALRVALGIERFDFYGASNAAQDIQAYAARFPDHLRSAVLDTPNTTVDKQFDPFTARGWLRTARLLCQRSAACAAERRNAAKAAGRLARQLRKHPVSGTARDADNARRRVRIGEGRLPWRLLSSDFGGFVAPSEIGAAADALRAGDKRPLLRLAAENAGKFFVDEGDPEVFSVGDNFARYCNDNPMPWDKSLPRSARKAQYEALRGALPADAFAPFSVGAWLAPLPTGPLGPDVCLDWPAPTYEIPFPVPAGSQLPAEVPALILAADLDLSTVVGLVRSVNRAWTGSRLIKLANSGHHATVNSRSGCANAIIVDFIADLDPGTTGCASRVRPMFPAVGRFAATAAEARPARGAEGDRSTLAERRIATVATAAVTDAIRRAFIQSDQGAGPGLRGGTFSSTFGDADVAVELDRARFARDVAVSGSAAYGFENEILRATIKVRGPRGERGRLRIHGFWFAFRHDATALEVRGRLGGHRVRVLVPAS